MSTATYHLERTENSTAGSESTANSQSRVVAIDDDPMTLRLLRHQLKKAGFHLETAKSGVSGLELVDDSVAVALVDLRLPDLDGFEILRHIRKQHPAVQVIILTGSDDVRDAVEAMREGAFQYLTKPFDLAQLTVFIEKAIRAWDVENENSGLRDSFSIDVPANALETAGDTYSRLIQQINQIAALDSTVFIGGETGTGKSTKARMIHQKSPRAKGPFVTVNCASLPKDLIHSELFGHAKGSFTGAIKDRIGHVEVAHGGTLFLDEIGDLPLDLQPKLLTFLQDRTFQRLGCAQERRVDVRLITATHRDLAEMCREGLFRQDLYFRLLVLHLELPALRHRSGEMLEIAHGIIRNICTRQSIPTKSLSESANALLLSHDWPGNIRELENVLERAIALSTDAMIGPQDLLFSNVSLDRRQQFVDTLERKYATLPSRQTSAMESERPTSPPVPSQSERKQLDNPPINDVDEPYSIAKLPDEVEDSKLNSVVDSQLVGRTLKEIERQAIIQNLHANAGNKAKTARVLGISEKSIYNKMKRLQITEYV